MSGKVEFLNFLNYFFHRRENSLNLFRDSYICKTPALSLSEKSPPYFLLSSGSTGCFCSNQATFLFFHINLSMANKPQGGISVRKIAAFIDIVLFPLIARCTTSLRALFNVLKLIWYWNPLRVQVGAAYSNLLITTFTRSLLLLTKGPPS